MCNDIQIHIQAEQMSGDIAFFDTQGTSDPEYTGLGERWVLCYFPASELS